MKKISAFTLLSLFLLLFIFCSCKRITEDPFLTVTDTESGIAAESDANTDAATDMPGADFYSLTKKESVEKYGYVGIINEDNHFDGENYYFGNFAAQNPDGTYTSMTLFYRKAFDENPVNNTVCKDPLCKHTADTNCPLYGINTFNFIIHNGKLFFTRIDNNRWYAVIYNFETNKSKVISGDEYTERINLYRINGDIYYECRKLIDNKEDENDFITVCEFGKISLDGEITKLGQVNAADLDNVSDHIIYDGRYVVFKEDYAVKGEIKARVKLYDLQTDEITTVFEADYSTIEKCKKTETWPQTLRLFDGYKLLIKVEPLYNYNFDYIDYYVLDLKTKEVKLQFRCDRGITHLLQSDKYLIYTPYRADENEPFIIRAVDMINGTDKEYDLSALTNETVIKEAMLSRFESGVLTIRYNKIIENPESGTGFESKLCNLYALDFENGRVFKYDISDD